MKKPVPIGDAAAGDQILSIFPITSLTSREMVAISAPAAQELSEMALARVKGPGS